MSDLFDGVQVGPPVDGTEAEMLVGSLEGLRRSFSWKCGGLDSAGLQAKVGASAMTLGGLLKHLARVETDYFCAKLWGRRVPAPFDAVDPVADREWEWRTAAHDSPDELMALWEAAVVRSRELLADALAESGLEFTCRSEPSGDAPSTLRWLLLDLLEAYARHTGHADLIREAVDGLVGEDPPA